MSYVYFIDGVVPKAFTNARKACERLWSLEAPTEHANDAHRHRVFVEDGAKCLRRGGVVAPKWREGCPKITPVELYA